MGRESLKIKRVCRDVVVIFMMEKVQKSTGNSTLSIAISRSDKYGPEKDSHAPMLHYQNFPKTLARVGESSIPTPSCSATLTGLMGAES